MSRILDTSICLVKQDEDDGRWADREHQGQTLKVPECIEITDHKWIMRWPCPDGSVCEQTRTISSDPERDLVNLIHDGLLAAAMITVRPGTDSVHDVD